MAEVRELAHIYRVLAGARIRADHQYRFAFYGYTVTQGLITFVDFLTIAVIFGRIDSLEGWSVAEVAFLYGTSAVSFHLGDVFISQVERAPQRIRLGTFDALLYDRSGPSSSCAPTTSPSAGWASSSRVAPFSSSPSPPSTCGGTPVGSRRWW